MNRTNTVITKFKTRDEFESTIDSIAKLQLQRSKLIAERDIKSQKVLANYNPEITAIEEEISTLQGDAIPYAVANQERLFGKKRSASCSLAIYGFKKGNKKVINKSGYADAILAEKLFNRDYTNCAEASFKLNKKGIQKALKDGDEEIAKLFEETQDERFYVEAKTDKEIEK